MRCALPVDEAVGDFGDTADAAIGGQVADKGTLDIVQRGNLASFGRGFEASQDGFFELTNAFAGDAEELTNLLEGFAAVKQAKTARDDLSLTFLVDHT